jgi:hypothetical protein
MLDKICAYAIIEEDRESNTISLKNRPRPALRRDIMKRKKEMNEGLYCFIVGAFCLLSGFVFVAGSLAVHGEFPWFLGVMRQVASFLFFR